MRKIKQLTLSFPHGASIRECQSIVVYAENEIMAGVSEGGMQITNKYGLNVDNVTFSEDMMHFIFGHNRLQEQRKERCDNCGSYDFSVVRDMTSRRICKCGASWECPK